MRDKRGSGKIISWLLVLIPKIEPVLARTEVMDAALYKQRLLLKCPVIVIWLEDEDDWHPNLVTPTAPHAVLILVWVSFIQTLLRFFPASTSPFVLYPSTYSPLLP
jgi:hypothetical protein